MRFEKSITSMFAIASIAIAGTADAQSAAPDNPSGFGKAISAEARDGATAETVTNTVLDPSNPPGQIADNIGAFRDFLGAAPNPPGNPNPGRR